MRQGVKAPYHTVRKVVSHLRHDGDGVGNIEVPGVVQPDGRVEGVRDGSP